MGLLVDGVWHDNGTTRAAPAAASCAPRRSFRNWVTPDGSPGPTGEGGFKAEAGRYHLYVSLACPWASRTLIFRALKGLEGMIGVSVTHWLMAENGWTFAPGEGVMPDAVNSAATCTRSTPRPMPTTPAASPCPCCGTSRRGTIVNNEFAEIIRMLNSAFDGVGRAAGRLLSSGHCARRSMRSTSASTTPSTTASTRPASPRPRRPTRRRSVAAVRDAGLAGGAPGARAASCCGDRLTEADWRLFTTLVRFDPVYHRPLQVQHPPADRLSRTCWPTRATSTSCPASRATVNFAHIKRHYYQSHRTINPTGIVPVGPAIDFDAPPGRETLAA